MRYNNYHKHTHYSNKATLDCVVKPEDYMQRAVELGHTTYFTTEHGFQGNVYEAQTLCEKYNLKPIYGVEAYYVDDIEDKNDRQAFHLMLVGMTENGRYAINKIMSIANTEGFYYKPRIGLKELLSLDPKDVVVTSACIASRLFKDTENGKNWKDDFFIPVKKHFGDHFYLEVQAHVDQNQANYNAKIMQLAKATDTKIIHACDSHYIKPEDAKWRDLFLKAKGIEYEDESGFVLDYPTAEEVLDRYEKQGILTREEALEALNNTLIFDEAEPIYTDKEFKIPKIVEGDSNKILRKLINEGWKREGAKIPEEERPKYLEQIKYEYKIIEDCGMADYFILDHYIVNKAVKDYGAILTRTGRGSAVSFYVNKLLGLTEVDRISAPITLYPTRFMSAERILSQKSLPDIDLNFADVEPVIRASKDYLGEDGIYYMIAYKPLQASSAFRLYCKAIGKDIKEYDDVAKFLAEKSNSDEEFMRQYPEWAEILKESYNFRGVIESVSPSPCSFALLNDPISEKIGLMKVGDVTCCCLDGYNCDYYKYLKNDYLTVTVYQVISDTYKLLGKPIDSIEEMLSKCDDKVWDIYAKGLTTTINQADSDFDKQILTKYKPRSLAEMSAYVAAIRPGFASLLNNFVERKPYTTGVKELDDILDDSFHYLMYQESIMKYLVWLGIEEKGTYDIIKKIAKKKFKEAELAELKTKLREGWIKKVGKEEGFDETWQVVEDASRYSFNASHSLSVALDSLYGAYLKSHHSLEYFTTVLSIYSDDLDRTASLIKELDYFGIRLNPIKFRHSRADYSMEKETNSIYKGIASIKYMNVEVAEKLYEMKGIQFDSFIDLLNVFPGNSRQREILISLNFFEEFGKTRKLLKICDLYDKFHGMKRAAKDKLKGIPEEIIKKYIAKETDKQYVFEGDGSDKMLTELCNLVPDTDLPLQTRLKRELEYLGYVELVMPEKERIGAVFQVNTKYTPKLTIYNLWNGEMVSCKLNKKAFAENPLVVGDTIEYTTMTKPGWKMDENGKWVADETKTDLWIKTYGKCEI